MTPAPRFEELDDAWSISFVRGITTIQLLWSPDAGKWTKATATDDDGGYVLDPKPVGLETPQGEDKAEQQQHARQIAVRHFWEMFPRG